MDGCCAVNRRRAIILAGNGCWLQDLSTPHLVGRPGLDYYYYYYYYYYYCYYYYYYYWNSSSSSPTMR